NGLGKSTLVKTLMGMVEPLGGEYMFGHQIEAAYFDQQLAQFSTSRTVLEEVWDEHPELDHTAVRKVLGQLMFTADDVFKSCDVLSGGEKVRLSLAKLMLQQPNLLVLDEPTNHLDIMGKEALEDALQSYTGTLIFVSHDRYFIQKLATCILCVEGDKTAFYPLNYDEYMEKDHKPMVSEKPAEEKKPVSQAKQQRENVKKTAQLERMITRAERELEELREKRFDPEYYHDNRKMDALEEAIDEKHNEIAHLMEEWEEYAATTADS
ncbi:MAG: ABC-F family ATP-binding cassette domain-containing protein, partial [Erysipelotrichaceae bacterium]|nr:ABC-F family ATP-binding cassette domain-containing protein [Erysipelotrichaceae bacterium]